MGQWKEAISELPRLPVSLKWLKRASLAQLILPDLIALSHGSVLYSISLQGKACAGGFLKESASLTHQLPPSTIDETAMKILGWLRDKGQGGAGKFQLRMSGHGRVCGMP